MDREQFREQITERYVTGKALEGASLEEIAEGMVNPAEQVDYVTGMSKSGSAVDRKGSEPAGTFWLVLILLAALVSIVLSVIR
jgi:hypothetical protein